MNKFLLHTLAVASLFGSLAFGQSTLWVPGGTVGNNTTNSNVGIGTSAPAYKLDVAGDVHATGYLFSSTKNYQTSTLSNGDGWYRIAATSIFGSGGRVRLWGLTGNNEATDITFYASGMAYGQGGTIQIVNNLYYNANHVSNIRVGSDPVYGWVIDVQLANIANPTPLKVETDGQITLLSTPIFNPTDPSGSVVVSGHVLGGGSSAWSTYLGPGHVGIGTPTPGGYWLNVAGSTYLGSSGNSTLRLGPQQSTLEGAEIDWDAASGGFENWTTDIYGHKFRIFKSSSSTDSTDQVEIFNAGSGVAGLYVQGSVGIGISDPGSYKLAVNGAIHTKEVVVDMTGWSDYVFKPGYRLASLDEVASTIKQEGHLPGLPSAQEVSEHGVSLGEMQAKLLAKIEELTLHQIEQEKRLSAQSAQLAAQSAQLATQSAQLAEQSAEIAQLRVENRALKPTRR